MADLQILATGVAAAPSDVVIPDSAEIQPKSVRATFDGSGAGGAFLPTLVLVSDAGHEAWRIPTAVPVEAGGSAEVTWAPFLDGRPPGLPFWTDILADLSLNYGTIKTDVGNSYAYTTVQADAAWATVAKATTASGDVESHEDLRALMVTQRKTVKQVKEAL